MARQFTRKNWIMIFIGVLSIIGLLSYTWIHTSNLLATYVQPAIFGFLAAAGIELSIVGLSMRIGELKKSGLNYRFFTVTLVAVVAVSALANIAEGFLVRYGEPITVGNIGKLDLAQAIILIAATGLISLVTLALSELIGQDVTTAQKIAQRNAAKDSPEQSAFTVLDSKPSDRQDAPQIEDSKVPQLEAPKGGVVSYSEFKQRMIELGDSAPKSIGEVERVFGLSHSTADRRLKEYRKEFEAR